VRTADDSYTKSYAQKVGVVDDPANPNGWYVRHVSGGGAASANEAISLSDGEDGNVGFFLRVLTNSRPDLPLFTQLVLDSGDAGGGADSDAGVARGVVADGEWHFYEWDLDDAAQWTAWRDAAGNVIGGSDGALPAGGRVSIDSIVLRGGNANVEFYLDGVMHNAGGSLAEMLPVPEPGAVAWAVLAAGLLLRRAGRKE
jgi:hypothetical protein